VSEYFEEDVNGETTVRTESDNLLFSCIVTHSLTESIHVGKLPFIPILTILPTVSVTASEVTIPVDDFTSRCIFAFDGSYGLVGLDVQVIKKTTVIIAKPAYFEKKRLYIYSAP
jgi:hypothetical protein